MKKIENRMTVDRLWENVERETRNVRDVEDVGDVREKSDRAGYRNRVNGTFVLEEYAFVYAVERISHAKKEEKQEFVEWFYSGDWVKEEVEDGRI